jgi:tetratricopeptide (TPR) repeat protein
MFAMYPLNLFSNLGNYANISDAERAIKEENYTKAINIYSNLIKLTDSVATFYYGRGMAHYYANTLDNAINDFSECIALNPNYIDAYLGMANCYIEKEQYKNAILLLNKKINIDTNDIEDLYYCRGLSYYLDGDYQKAIDDYNKVLNTDNNNYGYAIYGRGIANYKAGNYANAKTDLEHCIAKTLLTTTYTNECQRLLLIINNKR